MRSKSNEWTPRFRDQGGNCLRLHCPYLRSDRRLVLHGRSTGVSGAFRDQERMNRLKLDAMGGWELRGLLRRVMFKARIVDL